MATNILRNLKQCVTLFDPMRGPAGQEEPQSNLTKACQDWKRNFEDCPAVEEKVDDTLKKIVADIWRTKVSGEDPNATEQRMRDM